MSKWFVVWYYNVDKLNKSLQISWYQRRLTANASDYTFQFYLRCFSLPTFAAQLQAALQPTFIPAPPSHAVSDLISATSLTPVSEQSCAIEYQFWWTWTSEMSGPLKWLLMQSICWQL